ncbi:TonB-dependent receptor plug domain-containing protein [Flavobacteriaceae bacterium R38]|nr:TonB-dependent receptor plug domain-containing protein [Flavobacteriaceae bacterium R38]
MKYLFCFIFLLCIHTSLFSQDEKQVLIGYNDISLKNVLKDLETSFNVRFSFKDIYIENKKVTLTKKLRTLPEILRFLEDSFFLNLKKATNRYIIITPQRRDICGIVSAKEALDLSSASVISLSEKKGTITSKEGKFQLDQLLLNDTIQVQYIGFKTYKIPVLAFIDKPCLEIELFRTYQELDEVVLSEYLTRGISQKKDGAISIHPGKLNILPGLTEPDVLQSVQLLPGVESPDETSSGLYVRGGTPDQNLILWDGITIYHTGHFFGLISAFNPYITEEINVYKGGVKARYGNRISGIIDIQTDSKIPDSLTGGAGFNMTHADAYLKVPIGKSMGVIVSARRSISDVLNTFTFNKFSKRVFQNTNLALRDDFIDQDTDLNFSDASIKFLAEPSSKDKLVFTGVFVENKLDNNFSFTQTNFRSNTTQDITNNGWNAQWKHDWSNALNHLLEVKQSSYDFTFEDNIQTDDQSSSSDSRSNKIQEFGIDFLLNWKLNKHHTITSGYQFENNEVSFDLNQVDAGLDGLAINSRGIINSHTLFSEYKFTNKIIHAIGGLRATFLSFNDIFNLEPRIHLEANIVDDLKLKSSAEIRYQSISQIIDFINTNIGLNNQVWSLTNDFTPLLQSRQISFGVLYNKNNWSVDLEAYYKKISGVTSFTNGFGSDVLENSFEGESTIKGFDLLVKKKLRDFRFWFGYSLGKTDFNFPDIQESDFPGNFDIRHSLQIAATYNWKPFQFSLGWNYRTGIPFTEAPTVVENNGEFFRVNESLNSERLPDYHRLDFSATYDFFFSKKRAVKATTGVSILNLYDRRSVLNRSFNVFLDENNNPFTSQVELSSLRITPNLVFRISF